MIFDYPGHRPERRHGPAGYLSCESYRDWLRDEFAFRCAYCLKRETWGQVTSEFELDHFEPQSISPMLRLDYLNLVYACRRCNAVKSDQTVGDPFQYLCSSSVKLLSDGRLQPLDKESQRLILQLDLNSPNLIHWRIMWLRIVSLAKDRDTDLYRHLVGFPLNLPDLGKLRPPQNHRKQGLQESWFAQRQRGELPAEY